MRASKTMRDRVLQHAGITVHYNTAVADAFGDGDGLQGLRLVDTVDGAKRDLPLRGLFYGIGHNPNSSLVNGQVCFSLGRVAAPVLPLLFVPGRALGDADCMTIVGKRQILYCCGCCTVACGACMWSVRVARV